MTLQHYVLKTFLMYISVKAALFLPVCWYALLRWWADRSGTTSLTSDSTEAAESGSTSQMVASS